MSSHRISRPTQALAELIAADLGALSTDRIRQALPADARTMLPEGMEAGIVHATRAMTSGNRAALYATMTISPSGYAGVARRTEVPVIVSWTFHGAIVTGEPGMIVELDRISIESE